MNYPNKKRALEILYEAETTNPGNWIKHSLNVAYAASVIASKCNLDSEKAYVLGLLHDIGRFSGVSHLHHVIAGYRYMSEYQDVARICITHSFPIKEVSSFTGLNDCSQEETNTIQKLLNEYQFDDYDRLIQLCDCIASHKSICLIEVRLIDVLKRRGFNEYSIIKFEEYEKLLTYFSKLCHCNIYTLFKKELEYGIYEA